MNELPKRVQKYYQSLKNEEIIRKIKDLTNMQQALGWSENVADQINELKNEANRRDLKLEENRNGNN